MEDIKVGELVRLKNGRIDKVKNDDYYMQQYIECEKGLYLRDNITKHSFNLIDLLEVRRLCKWKKSKFTKRRYKFI